MTWESMVYVIYIMGKFNLWSIIHSSKLQGKGHVCWSVKLCLDYLFKVTDGGNILQDSDRNAAKKYVWIWIWICRGKNEVEEVDSICFVLLKWWVLGRDGWCCCKGQYNWLVDWLCWKNLKSHLLKKVYYFVGLPVKLMS